MEGPERHLITVGASFPMRGRRRARKHLKSPYAGLLRGCRTHDSSPDPTESDVDTTGQSSAPCGTVPCLVSCERKHQQPVREEPFRSSGEYSRSMKSQSSCQREDRPHGSLHQDGGVRLRVLDCRPSRNRLAAAASGRWRPRVSLLRSCACRHIQFPLGQQVVQIGAQQIGLSRSFACLRPPIFRSQADSHDVAIAI